MKWLDTWRDWRTWRREWKSAPLRQFRFNVEHRIFAQQNSKKQRWAEWRLWWLDNRGWLLTVLISLAALVGTYVGLFRK
jgi:hypothetical protein